MEVTNEDEEDIVLAHKYRLNLKSAPRQSSFRVVAIIFYELGGSNERLHVAGTNDEPCYINGSICAERAALVQMRFLPVQRITKVVITTDAAHPIFPGMLCREFMSSHLLIDPETVAIVTSGSLCRRSDCHLNIGKDGRDQHLEALESPCCDGKNKYHNWEVVKTLLPKLYPHASPYTRLSSSESIQLGAQLKKSEVFYDEESMLHVSAEEILRLVGKATDAARIGDDRSELHPIQYGAAILFEDGSVETAYQRKTLEYGCSLDAVTQLAVNMEKKARTHAEVDSQGKSYSDESSGERDKIPSITPKVLVQTDQYGVIHAPFASARAFLSEFGYGNCGVLIQKVIASCSAVEANAEQDHSPSTQIAYMKVQDIAPNAPDMGSLWIS